MNKLIQQVCTLLGEGEDLVLCTISSQSGSTPRLAGAKMIIRRDNRIHGTIGGGMVEAFAMQEAEACFTSRLSLHRSFDLSNGDVDGTDMICGGQMELFLEYIQASEANRTVFHTLLTAMTTGRHVTLVCPFDNGAGYDQRFVIDHLGRSSRVDTLKPLLSAIKQTRSFTSTATLIKHQGLKYLLSNFAIAGHLILVGAGHVSACTAKAAAQVGFRITVMDDRAEFANRERFQVANHVQVLTSFNNCFQHHNIDADSCLVIVTRGHMHDMEVLDQALQTKAGYIGMIGSLKKRNAIYAKLMNKGINEMQLERVHCPIGITIEADTPEEIAVSIVGELIYHRAIKRKAWHLI